MKNSPTEKEVILCKAGDPEDIARKITEFIHVRS